MSEEFLIFAAALGCLVMIVFVLAVLFTAVFVLPREIRAVRSKSKEGKRQLERIENLRAENRNLKLANTQMTDEIDVLRAERDRLQAKYESEKFFNEVMLGRSKKNEKSIFTV